MGGFSTCGGEVGRCCDIIVERERERTRDAALTVLGSPVSFQGGHHSLQQRWGPEPEQRGGRTKTCSQPNSAQTATATAQRPGEEKRPVGGRDVADPEHATESSQHAAATAGPLHDGGGASTGGGMGGLEHQNAPNGQGTPSSRQKSSVGPRTYYGHLGALGARR